MASMGECELTVTADTSEAMDQLRRLRNAYRHGWWHYSVCTAIGVVVGFLMCLLTKG